MKDELIVLLGCGLTALLVTNACSSMYSKNDEEEDDGHRRRQNRRRMMNECEGYNGCSSYSSDMKPSAAAPPAVSVDYYSEPAVPEEPSIFSPLMFSKMVTNEPYIESDYIEMKEYNNNPDGIKTFNEKDGSVGLPVTDMTDISAGENNKYVYDRTIGTIGFTSTKIGGRTRGLADYIRGDLPIVPNKDSGWFQTSSDPANKLLRGAMNVENGIGQAPAKPKGSGGAHALGAASSLDDLREQQDSRNQQGRPGAQFAQGETIPDVTIDDIIAASRRENSNFAGSIGVKTS